MKTQYIEVLMPKRSSNNKFPERGKSKTGRYSTITDGTARSAKSVTHKKKSPMGAVIVIILAAVVVATGSLLFFNWDKIVNLRDDTLEQINGTPTPIPTKMITPTPRSSPRTRLCRLPRPRFMLHPPRCLR